LKKALTILMYTSVAMALAIILKITLTPEAERGWLDGTWYLWLVLVIAAVYGTKFYASLPSKGAENRKSIVFKGTWKLLALLALTETVFVMYIVSFISIMF